MGPVNGSRPGQPARRSRPSVVCVTVFELSPPGRSTGVVRCSNAVCTGAGLGAPVTSDVHLESEVREYRFEDGR
jgi:hypothetical protein